jgi:hypothetical protein
MNTTDEIAETDPALIAPAIARACGRCHDRKVKVRIQLNYLTKEYNLVSNHDSATFKSLNVDLVNANK